MTASMLIEEGAALAHIHPRTRPRGIHSARRGTYRVPYRIDHRNDGGTRAIVKGPTEAEESDHMAELVRTNDPALISVIEGLLAAGQIPHHVADRNMSILDGSIPVVQQRVLVPDELEAEAREILVDADLGQWLRS